MAKFGAMSFNEVDAATPIKFAQQDDVHHAQALNFEDVNDNSVDNGEVHPDTTHQHLDDHPILVERQSPLAAHSQDTKLQTQSADHMEERVTLMATTPRAHTSASKMQTPSRSQVVLI